MATQPNYHKQFLQNNEKQLTEALNSHIGLLQRRINNENDEDIRVIHKVKHVHFINLKQQLININQTQLEDSAK